MSEVVIVGLLVAIGVVITLFNSVDLIAIVALALQQRFGWPKNIRTGSEKLVGQNAIAVGEFRQEEGQQIGRVRIHGENWKAIATDGSTVQEGSEVRVEKVEGLSVFVTLNKEVR